MGQVARPRRRRWPVALVVLAAVLAAAVVALDVVARDATQNAIATDVRRSTHSKRASATISSFPFLYDVLVDGRLSTVSVTDSGVPAGPVLLDRISLVASDVRFSRSELIQHRTVRITAVGRATLVIQIRLSNLANSLATDLGVEVVPLGPGRIGVRAAGHTLATVNLTKVPLIPGCSLDVAHRGDLFTLGCTVAPVPASVLAALSKARG